MKRPVAAIAALTGLSHLVVATRYGWHRDEFYYVTTGRHLAWGFVDQPPIVPFVARIAAAFPGGVLPLRIVAIAAQIGCVLLAAALACELGGTTRAQVLTAAAVATAPIFIGGSVLLGTTVMDQLAWVALLYLTARALNRMTTLSWVVLGLVAGLGLETKHTLVVLIGGIFLGLIATRRDVLRTSGPWLAGVIALAIWLPNLAWDAAHNWVSLDMARVLSNKQGGPVGALVQFPALPLLLMGPIFIPVWIAGVRWLVRGVDGRPHRWIAIVAGVAVVMFTASGGRVYYAAPAFVGLLAAGAVAIEERMKVGFWRVTVPISWVAWLLLTLPFLPPMATSGFGPGMIETYGWPAFTAQVAATAALLPAGTSVFTSNYGEAGAFAYYARTAGLRVPVYSAHNAYGSWGPPSGTPVVVLAVGEFDAAYLRKFWGDVTLVRPLVLPHNIKDEETRNHAGMYVCRSPHGSWAAMWPKLRHLD